MNNVRSTRVKVRIMLKTYILETCSKKTREEIGQLILRHFSKKLIDGWSGEWRFAEKLILRANIKI